MSVHETLVPYNKYWALFYLKEKDQLLEVLGSKLLDIQHIGSTSIFGLSAKPIIDIAALIEHKKDAEQFIAPLKAFGYELDEEASSSERHFFRKYGIDNFHLSIAYKNAGSFWQRQIFFRDYLRSHREARMEYEELKLKLIAADPSGKNEYINGKSEFVNKILTNIV